MARSAPRTTPNDGDVEGFVASVADERRRRDTAAALRLIQEVTAWGAPG